MSRENFAVFLTAYFFVITTTTVTLLSVSKIEREVELIHAKVEIIKKVIIPVTAEEATDKAFCEKIDECLSTNCETEINKRVECLSIFSKLGLNGQGMWENKCEPEYLHSFWKCARIFIDKANQLKDCFDQ